MAADWTMASGWSWSIVQQVRQTLRVAFIVFEVSCRYKEGEREGEREERVGGREGERKERKGRGRERGRRGRERGRRGGEKRGGGEHCISASCSTHTHTHHTHLQLGAQRGDEGTEALSQALVHLKVASRHGNHQAEHKGERAFDVAAKHRPPTVCNQCQCVESPHLRRVGGEGRGGE